MLSSEFGVFTLFQPLWFKKSGVHGGFWVLGFRDSGLRSAPQVVHGGFRPLRGEVQGVLLNLFPLCGFAVGLGLSVRVYGLGFRF